MADRLPSPLPGVRLELRDGGGKLSCAEVSGAEFLIGAAAGCDWRLAEANIPPVLCVISRHPDKVQVRKFATAVPLQLNGQSFTSAELNSGDRLTLGPLTFAVTIDASQRMSEPLADEPAQVHFAPIDPVPLPRLAKIEHDDEDLARREEQYKSDLIRLDRLQGTLDERERKLAERLAEVERRETDVGERETQFDESLKRQREQADQLSRLHADWTARTALLNEREQAIEAQQSALTALRSRMERTRDEVRNEAALLVEQRARQEATEHTLQELSRQIERQRAEFAAEQESAVAAKLELDERGLAIQETLAQLKQLEERLAADSAALDARKQELDRQAAEQITTAEQLQRQAAELAELQLRLNADRTVVSERGAAIGQTDEVRRALQEQLQRRADELATREKQLEEAARLQAEAAQELEQLRERIAATNAEIEAKWAAGQEELRARSATADERAAELARREETLQRHVEKLRAVGVAVAAERKANFVARSQWAAEQSALVAESDALRAELENFRQRTAEDSEQFQQQLPELELRGEAVFVRLALAREQLRAHVAELHDYTQQCHRDLQTLRSQIQSDYERVRAAQLAVQHERSEHRLAVTAFRQQLIEWQGRIADMRQMFAHDGTRLEWKQAEVDAAARQLDATSQKLARQAADLSVQEQEVNERRTEMERHLGDMREWYRRKLRELAHAAPASAEMALPKLAIAEEPEPADEFIPATIAADLDPADRQLGELLSNLELIEPDALATLLNESRRQRRSLRQVLLSSRDGGMPLLTLYQLALIEAGNLDGLVLGRLRVVDRLMVNPRESIYRVFDPRRGGAALLRQLGEADAGDADRAAEFRERFEAATAIRHDNVAATLEVLDINGRPAVLQEWVAGLSSADWPSAAAAPGVWFRLMMQAALGLDAAHRAGQCHGHLSPRTILITGVGVVKVLGFGDPPWLAGVEAEGTVAGDLIALGGLATSWAALAPRRRGNKPPKPLPAALQGIIDRLRPDVVNGFTAASEVLAALEAAGTKLPDASDAWDELLEHAAQSGAAPAVWRKSA